MGFPSYIIDLESATHSKLAVIEPSPVTEFHRWGLAGVSMDIRKGGIDPMVPNRHAFLEGPYPSEEVMVELAAAAVGKPIRYPR
jgi:hypothetical protein